MKESYNPFSLTGKNIVITGASSGIGRETAIIFSRMGARVFLLGRNAVHLQDTLSLLKDPANHLSHNLDLTNENEIKELAIKIETLKGQIHGLVNCAGISSTLPLRMINEKKMMDFFHTNVAGAVNLSRIMLKSGLFHTEGASIVFISSVMGSVGEIGKTLYAMTKGALNAAVKSMAIELAPKNIRVNGVSPGVVQTPMSANAIYSRDENSLKVIEALHPLGLGLPEDVAYACAYLISDASRWVTGSNLFVDGGYTAR